MSEQLKMSEHSNEIPARESTESSNQPKKKLQWDKKAPYLSLILKSRFIQVARTFIENLIFLLWLKGPWAGDFVTSQKTSLVSKTQRGGVCTTLPRVLGQGVLSGSATQTYLNVQQAWKQPHNSVNTAMIPRFITSLQMTSALWGTNQQNSLWLHTHDRTENKSRLATYSSSTAVSSNDHCRAWNISCCASCSLWSLPQAQWRLQEEAPAKPLRFHIVSQFLL